MKLATFTHNGTQRIGIVVGDEIIDLSKADPHLPTDMIGFLELGAAAMADAHTIMDKGGPSLKLADVKLEAPVPNPGKILAIGLNYADHVEETGMKKPDHQIWFNKQRNAITGPNGKINLPNVSQEVLDYEAELVFVIGHRAKHVPRERAHEVIAGFCCGNDVSVRDWQMRTPTMMMGKSFDSHAPIGPWLVTPDEIGDPHNLDIKGYVNGEQRQSSNTKHLIFDCYDQIAHLTQAFTLDPGDVIFTGTPAGVGAAMKPPGFLKANDVVRIEIEKIGSIENEVVPESVSTVIGDAA